MTQNYRRVINENPYIFQEAVRNGGPLSSNTEATREAARARIRIKPAGPGVKSRKRAIEKYEGVRNSCPVCHLAMPVSGECC